MPDSSLVAGLTLGGQPDDQIMSTHIVQATAIAARKCSDIFDKKRN